MPTEKRRRFWVDPPLQLQMLAVVMILVLGSLFLTTYSVFHGIEEASLSTHQVFHSLDWVRETLKGPMIISAAISILASLLITLIWSHRFAGPLRVLCAAMIRIGHGNLSVPLRVRLSDAHQDLARDFAQMQEQLRERLQEDLRRMESAAARLKTVLSAMPEDHDARRSAEALIKELESIVSHYQL